MTGYSETTSQGTVAELVDELAHKPQRYRNPELVFRVVAQLGPITASELDAKLDLSVAEIDRAIRDHPGLLDVSEGPGEAIWDLAPGICRQCLCVESDACVDEETGETCDWANDERTLCTFCADDGDRQDDGDDVVDELVTGQDLALEDDIARQNDEETGGPGARDDAGEDLVQDEDDVDEDLVDDEELTARQRDILEALQDLGPNGETVSTSVLYPALAETWDMPLDTARRIASDQLTKTLKRNGHVEDRGYGKWALPGLDPPDPDQIVGSPPTDTHRRPSFYDDIYELVLDETYAKTEGLAKALNLTNHQVGARLSRDPRLLKRRRSQWGIRRARDVDDPWDVSDWPRDGDELEHEWPCPHKGVITPEGTQSCDFATRSVSELQEHRETCPLHPDRVARELEDDVDEDLVQDDDVILEDPDPSSEPQEGDELVHVHEQLLEERARVATLEDQVARLEERLEAAGRGQGVAEDLIVVHDQLEEELQEAKAREQELEDDLTDAWGRVDHLEKLLTARAQQEAPAATRPLVIAFLAFAIVVAVWVLGLWMGGAT